MMARAIPCTCRHPTCTAWLVDPHAAVQSVRFTKEEAHAVAALLNAMGAAKPDLRVPHQTKRYHIYWYEPRKPDIYWSAAGGHTGNQRDAARLTAAQLATTLPDAVCSSLSTRLELCIAQAPVIDGEDNNE